MANPIRAIYLDDENPSNGVGKQSPPIRAKYLDEDQTPKESLGVSLANAIPRMYGDVAGGLLNLYGNIPGYLEKSKTEIPGMLHTMMHDPRSAIRQGSAGLAEGIFRAANAPHDIASYGENRLNLLPEGTTDLTHYESPESYEGSVNRMLGTPQHPGEELIRGIARNLAPGAAIGKSASFLNPMKLTAGNIAKDVVNTEKKMKEKYSGENGLYNELSNEAKSRGITQANINPKKIDLDTIKKYSSEKNYESLDKFLADRNLTNAQKAISDLGFTERKLENKTTLLDPEKEQLKAVKNAKSYIQENMFKDESGKIHQDLLDRHKKIQEGYAKEVIPYSKNIPIQKYKRGKKLADELVDSLSKGEFAAQRGSSHTPLMIRRFGKKHPFLTGVGATSLAGLLYKSLTGEKNE